MYPRFWSELGKVPLQSRLIVGASAQGGLSSGLRPAVRIHTCGVVPWLHLNFIAGCTVSPYRVSKAWVRPRLARRPHPGKNRESVPILAALWYRMLAFPRLLLALRCGFRTNSHVNHSPRHCLSLGRVPGFRLGDPLVETLSVHSVPPDALSQQGATFPVPPPVPALCEAASLASTLVPASLGLAKPHRAHDRSGWRGAVSAY